MKPARIVNFSHSDGMKQILEVKNQCKPKIVFTSGVFDLVHAGHLEYLLAARHLGNSLIVGVNSDNSARRLEKGPSRPFVGAEDRAGLLACLRFVDGVILFDEDTPFTLLKALNPSIFVKGGDYSEKQLRDTDLKGLDDIELKLMPLKQNYSSTNLVRKIVAAHS